MSLENIPFIFWNKNSQNLNHVITCIEFYQEKLITGSETGEISVWTAIKGQYIPHLICTVGKELECRALAIIFVRYSELISSDVCVISLHEDSKLRVWDVNDGRCLRESENIFPELIRLDMMQTILKHYVAVTGENRDIYLVDTWSMEIVSIFSTKKNILKISSWMYLEIDYLISLDVGGNFYLWHVMNLNENISVKLDPVYSLHFPENPLSFSISPDNSLIAIWYDKSIRFIHTDSLKYNLQDNSIISLPQTLNGAYFYSDYFLILLEDSSLMIYESVNIINEITQCEITSFLFSSKTKLITLSTNSDYCLNFLKNSILYMPISVTNGIVYQNSLFSWEDQSIISTSLMSFEMKSHPFSIKVAKHENYADSRIFHFFKEDEIITVSCIYQTDNWPVYILGSSLGSILVVPFKPNQEVILYCYHKDAITCIYMSKKKLITCSADSLMCIWELDRDNSNQLIDFKHEEHKDESNAYLRSQTLINDNLPQKLLIRPEIRQIKPEQVIRIHGRPVNKVIELTLIDQDKSNEFWKRTLLCQCKDGSILLISLLNDSVICYFQALNSSIIEAYIEMSQNYLLVYCENKKLYIYDMAIQALERIIEAKKVNKYINKELNNHDSLKIKKSDLSISKFDENLLNYLNQNFQPGPQNWMTISHINIGGSEFSILSLNISKTISKILENSLTKGEAEFVISLLTCWKNDCKAHNSLKNYFKNSFELDEPIVSCNIGIKSLYDCYSFTLPINYDKFSISSHLTSQLLGSLIALVSSFSTSNTSLSTKIKHFSNSHINYHQNYKSSGLLSLTLQYLYGNLSIGFLIKQELPIIETSKKVKIFNNCKKIIEESQNLGFVEAVCGVIIGICHNYENLTFGIRVDENVVKMYEKMISSGVGSYVAITSRIIADNVKKWTQILSSKTILKFSREILKFISKNSIHKHIFYQNLSKIAINDLPAFLQFLSREIDRFDTDKDFPNACTSLLKFLLVKNYEEFPQFLYEIVEIIMKTLNPNHRSLRKNCIEKSSKFLYKLVEKLPIVSLSQASQKLAISTQDSLIIVYDLRTASNYKILKNSTSVLSFNASGKKIAAYSTKDCNLKIWKLKKGFLHEMLHSQNKPKYVIDLGTVENLVGSYKEFLDRVRIAWDDAGISLIREDLRAYIF